MMSISTSFTALSMSARYFALLLFLFLVLVASFGFFFLTVVVIRFLAYFCTSFMVSKRVSRSLASFMAVMTVLARLLVFFWSSLSVAVVVFRLLASPPLLMAVLGFAGVVLFPRSEFLGVVVSCLRATLRLRGVSPSLRAEVFLYLLGPACCAGGWGGGSILCWSWGSWSGPWFLFVSLVSP